MARHKFAVFSLIAIALASSLWLLLDVVGAHSRVEQEFGVVPFEHRFDELRKVLPPHTVVGYVSDNSATDPSSQSEFILTQYTLAPVLVRPYPDEHLVVLNYHTENPNAAAMAATHLVPVQKFGYGVMLCRNTTK